MSVRDLDWDGCVNVRDLGGLPTPHGPTSFGAFVRADNARKLTDEGWHAARDYGVRTVLDLRADPECAADPPSREGFAHVRLSLFETYDGDLDYRARFDAQIAHLGRPGRYRALYRQALEVDARRFAEAFTVLADADGCVLFHCVGGKDRTGLLAALLLRLADVPVDAVDEDYRASETRLPPPADTPRGVLDAVLDELGDVRGYLARAGVSDARIGRAAAKLRPQVGDR